MSQYSTFGNYGAPPKVVKQSERYPEAVKARLAELRKMK